MHVTHSIWHSHVVLPQCLTLLEPPPEESMGTAGRLVPEPFSGDAVATQTSRLVQNHPTAARSPNISMLYCRIRYQSTLHHKDAFGPFVLVSWCRKTSGRMLALVGPCSKKPPANLNGRNLLTHVWGMQCYSPRPIRETHKYSSPLCAK